MRADRGAAAAARLRPSSAEDDEADRMIAALAVGALGLEVETWPKPGLVSHIDPGSHADMDAGAFRRSAAALGPSFAALAAAGRAGCGMGRLRTIGLAAERAMLAVTGGVNTHRGAIFGLGLLCGAAGASEPDGSESLGMIVARRWGAEILDGPVPLRSHGGEMRRRHGAGGAPAEAAQGFPHLYGVGLPALRLGRWLAPRDSEAARVQCCFALIAELQDTNLLYRGGPSGLAFVQTAAAGFLRQGGVGQPDWRRRAEAVHRDVVARRLSPGGSADLLAMTLFVDAWAALPR